MSAADVRAFDDGDVEAAARAMSSTVPNSDGVLWVYDHEDGQQQPVTLKDAARAALAAVSDRIAHRAWDEGCSSGIAYQAGADWTNNPYPTTGASE